jgi:hypothetical protein
VKCSDTQCEICARMWLQERWEVYRITYVIARFLALNGVASIEVRAPH